MDGRRVPTSSAPLRARPQPPIARVTRSRTLANWVGVMRESVRVTRRCDTLVMWWAKAQQVVSAPFSAVGSICSANDRCANPSSWVNGTTSILGYSSGNSSWSSTTTAGRNLLGSLGKAPPRQSTTTILPASSRLTAARSTVHRARQALGGHRNARRDRRPLAPHRPGSFHDESAALWPRPSPGRMRSSLSPVPELPLRASLDRQGPVESSTSQPYT